MDVERVELEPGRMVGLHEVVPMAGLTEYFGRAMTASAGWLGRHGIAVGGPPLAVYRGQPSVTVDVTAGFPVDAAATVPGTDADAGEPEVVTLPGGPALVTVHTGPYDAMTGTYAALTAWIGENGVRPADVMWEEYLVGPDSEPDPARWQTRIVWPVA